VAVVAVRLPDGTRRRRRFYAASSTAGDVIAWLDATFDLNPKHLTLREAGMSDPKEGFACLGCGGGAAGAAQRALTLEALGFHTRQVLFTAEVHEESDKAEAEEKDEEKDQKPVRTDGWRP
jgi:hypothetical protein